jgi:peptide/nickel transport system permease protein
MFCRIARRLIAGTAIVLFVVTVTFFLINLAPGDPALLWVAPGAGDAELEIARRSLGLDRPLAIRYMSWLAGFVTGDWGVSLTQQRPVVAIIAAALPHTLLLSAASLLITYVGGILIGTLQAIRTRTALDTGLTISTLVVYGMPAYWLAIMLVLIFSYASARHGWPLWLRFPALGVASLDADFLTPAERVVDRLRHLTLPLLTLGLIGVAGTARFVRGAVLDTRFKPFVQTARAKGVSRVVVEVRHVLRNALLPVITLLGLSLPALFSGTVFVEVIFAWPGMGRVMVDAVGGRDYPIVMATTAIFASLVVIGNLLADILYSVADPRILDSRSG